MRAGSIYRGFRVARESAHRVAARLLQPRTIRCARAAFIVDFGWKRESAHRYSERDVSGRQKADYRQGWRFRSARTHMMVRDNRTTRSAESDRERTGSGIHVITVRIRSF